MQDTRFEVTHVLDINTVKVEVNAEFVDKLKVRNFPMDQCVGSEAFLRYVSDLETQDQVDCVLKMMLQALRFFVVERCDSPDIIIYSVAPPLLTSLAELDYFDNRNQF